MANKGQISMLFMIIFIALVVLFSIIIEATNKYYNDFNSYMTLKEIKETHKIDNMQNCIDLTTDSDTNSFICNLKGG